MRLLVLLAVASACGQTEPQRLPDYGAQTCAMCHVETHREWWVSRHSRSAESPVLRALLPKVEQAWGEAARDRCESCHSPGFGGDAAIGCVSCHAAVGNTAERDGALVVDTSLPLAGPAGDLLDTPHGSRPGQLLRSPSLCGTCHEVTGPGLFVEPTLTHYRASPAAAEGIGCADCHAAGGSHEFAGVDPLWGAGDEDRARAEAMSEALLETAFEVRVEPAGQGVVEVVLTNACKAHRVPAGHGATITVPMVGNRRRVLRFVSHESRGDVRYRGARRRGRARGRGRRCSQGRSPGGRRRGARQGR